MAQERLSEDGPKDIKAMEEMKLELMRLYISEIGTTETELGGYMSMIITACSFETSGK